MINITTLKQFATRLVAETELTKYILVTNEGQLSKRVQDLKQTDFPLLVVVIPSYDAAAIDRDNFKLLTQMLMFVLKRDRFQGQKPELLEEDMEETLSITETIIQTFMAGFDVADCTIPEMIVPGSYHIDPEVNFLGCNGWSISFQLKN